jgi:hypothetical protein
VALHQLELDSFWPDHMVDVLCAFVNAKLVRPAASS